jgi:hypothetical protein
VAPRWVRIRLCAASRFRASRTVERETSNCSPELGLGRQAFIDAQSRRCTIASRIASAIWTDRSVGAGRVDFHLSDN